jgi:Concanavalin A-like lectin/glucanases superfamily
MKKFLILLLTLFISTTFSFSQVNLKNGLVACYPFNGNANDETGNTNDGHVVGATLTADRFGKANSAYNFNGESYISITPAQFENTNYSYALWVNLDALPVEADNNSFFSVGGPGADQNLSVLYKYFSETNTGFSGGGYNAGNPVVSNNLTGSLPNTSRWYHLVSTRDNNSMKLYVDGVLFANNSGSNLTNGTNAAYSNPAYAVIGSRVGQNGYFQFTKGSIDDIYIYNRVINAEEVTALFQGAKSIACEDGLIACHPFSVVKTK